MTTRKKTSQTPPAVSTAPYWMWGGLVVGVALHVVHLPGGIVTWLALLIATFNSYAPEVTGKGEMGEPVAANPYEESLQRRHQAWRGLRGALFGLDRAALPWWPLGMMWVVAVALGVAAVFMPRLMVVPSPVAWGEGVAVFLVVVALEKMARDRGSDSRDPMPQVTSTDVGRSIVGGGWKRWIALLVCSIGASAVAVTGWAAAVELLPALIVVPELGPMPSDPITPELTVAIGWSIAATIAAVVMIVRPGVLADWRARITARETWKQRFSAKLPKLPSPDLLEHRELADGIAVDTFSVPGTQQREKYLQAVKELASTVGDGAGLYALTNLVDDGAGGKIESNTMFRYVTVGKDSYPDLSSGATSDDVAGLLVESLVSQQMEWEGPALSEATRLTEPESTAPVWMFEFDASRASIGPLRTSVEALSSMFGVRVLIDKGMLTAGAILSEDTSWDEQACGQSGDAMRAMYQDIADDDWWEKIWTGVEASPEKTPTYYPQASSTAELPDGGEVRYSAFVVRRDLTPEMYYGKEARLATAIQNPAFTAIMPFPDPVSSSAARTVRHVQAIAVAWAPALRGDGKPNRIPRTPQTVSPGRERTRQRGRSAQELILAGMVSRAFTATKLSQPLVTKARALSDVSARAHIWQVDVQLQSNTYAEVLKKLPNLRQELGCPWLQVEPTAEGASLYAGAEPTQEIVTAPRNWRKAIDLEWASTWVTANVIGSDGATPALVDATPLDGNPDVVRAEFDLPQTLTIERIKGSKAKLKSARGLQFLEITTGSAPTRMEMLFSSINPVPFPAPVDFEAMLDAPGYAFGVGYDGLPRAFVPARDAHMIMVGKTGTGKSVTLQMEIASAVAKGAWVAVIDPSKGGVDFTFADDWMIAPRAGTLEEAAATLEALYAEALERKALHIEYGVGSWSKLPKDVQRPEVLLVVDEFTSLVMAEKLPPKTTDPSAQRARAGVEQSNAKKAKIGNLIGKIFREARSVGFAVTLGTQKLDSKTLAMVPGGSDLKTNASRIILGNPSLGELQSALRDPYSVPDLGDYVPIGRGRFESADGGAELFQTWWAEQPELRALLIEADAPLPERTLDVERFMPRDEERQESEVDGESGLLVLKSAPVEIEEIEEIEMDFGDLTLDDLSAPKGEPIVEPGLPLEVEVGTQLEGVGAAAPSRVESEELVDEISPAGPLPSNTTSGSADFMDLSEEGLDADPAPSFASFGAGTAVEDGEGDAADVHDAVPPFEAFPLEDREARLDLEVQAAGDFTTFAADSPRAVEYPRREASAGAETDPGGQFASF